MTWKNETGSTRIPGRPRCAHCGKPLRPRFEKEVRTTPEKLYDAVLALQQERALCVRSKTAGAWTSVVEGWFGKYLGYGRDAQNLPIFDTQTCGVQFAAQAYRFGYRSRETK